VCCSSFNDLLDACPLASPFLDGLDIITHAFASLESSRGISDNFLEVGNSSGNIATLGSLDGSCNVLLYRFSAIVAGLDLSKFVFLHE